MKKYIKLLCLLLLSFGLKAQTLLPANLPNPKAPTAYYWLGWLKADSGIINALRNTSFTPLYPGTQVFQIRPGVDSLPWWWTGQRWITFPTTGGSGNLNSFNFTNQNGLTGTVSQPNGPNVNLALGTSLNGIVKGNGTGFGTVVIGSGLTYDGTTLSAGTNINALISGNGTNFIATTIGAGLSYNTGTHTLTNTIVNNNQLINGAGYITNITGLVTAGSNIYITGNGTAVSPYVINATGGGSVTGAGNLSPLFTTSVSVGTINFAFQNPSAFTIFGNPQGVSAAPMYFGINSTLAFVGNILGVSTSAPLNFYQTIAQVDSFTFTLNTPTGRHDTVRIHLPTNGFISTLNNGLTLTGTNGQLGGPLVQNTVINGGNFSLGIQGNRFATGMGAAIAAANNLTTGSDGNLFSVTGSTQINAIATTNWQAGSEISFIFTGSPILKNNTAGGGGTAVMLLAGSIDYQAAPGDYIKLQYDGSVWHEVTRKLTSAGGAYIFSNGITESPATRVKLGGTLTQNTTLAGAGTFWFAINGGRFQTGAGAPIVAANNLVTGSDGNQFSTTGNTQINAITTTNWQAGAHIELIFTGTPLLKNNTAGGVNTATMQLAGSVDYQAAAGDLIGLSYDGTVWHETNRKLAGSVSNITLSNGLTLTGTNGVWGGTLLQNTTITGGAFTTTFTSTVAGSTTPTVTINNTSTGYGLSVTANNNDAIHGTGVNGGAGVIGTTDFGNAVFGNAGVGGLPVGGQVLPNTSTSVDNAFEFIRSAFGGVGAANEGLVGSWLLPNTVGGNLVAVKQTITATNAVNATFAALYAINGYTAGSSVPWMDINGQTANFYGTGGSSISAIGGQLGATLTGSVTGVLASGPIPYWGTNTSTVTNTVVDGLLLQRNGAYNGAPGVGIQIRMESKGSTGVITTANTLISKFTTTTLGSEVSEFDVQVLNGGGSQVTKFAVAGPATSAIATRFEYSAGGAVSSANNLTLGTDGNVFHITGATQINAITVANWQAGSELILIFDSNPVVKNNTAGGGGTAVLHLAGAVDFNATSSDVLTLVYDGSSFFEKCRSVN